MSAETVAVTLTAETVEAIAAAITRGTARSPWMTADDAADYLRFPKKRVYGLVQRHEIPHRRQEGRLLFHRDELDAWLDGFYQGPVR